MGIIEAEDALQNPAALVPPGAHIGTSGVVVAVLPQVQWWRFYFDRQPPGWSADKMQ